MPGEIGEYASAVADLSGAAGKGIDVFAVQGLNGIGDASGIAMRAILRDLEPNRRYHCRVVARANAESPRVGGETRTKCPGPKGGSTASRVAGGDGSALHGLPDAGQHLFGGTG